MVRILDQLLTIACWTVSARVGWDVFQRPENLAPFLDPLPQSFSLYMLATAIGAAVALFMVPRRFNLPDY